MQVSEAAWREIARQDAGRGRWVQFVVMGGGCNGFQYGMTWMNPLSAFTNDNHLLEPVWIGDRPKIFVDPKSFKLISDMTLDFKPLKGFVFDNPKVTSSCGCGKSVGF
jgi:iron-sulfur cluster assembly accessory protein